MAWADPPSLAFIEPLNVNLVERVTDGIGLVADQLAIGPEISLAGSRKPERHLPHVGEVLGLRVWSGPGFPPER